MKKVIFLDEEEVKRNLKEIYAFKDKMNRTYQILQEFGIEDTEAVKTPLEAANIKLKGILSHDEKFEVDPGKAADMIGKSELYKELQGLNKQIVKSKFLELLRWNKQQFSFRGNVEKDIREAAAVVITNEKQIELHNRTEAFIKESEELTELYGEKYSLSAMVNLLNPLMIKQGRIKINHYIFLKVTNRLAQGIEVKKPEPKPRRIMGVEKAYTESVDELKHKLTELKAQLEQKINDGVGEFELSKIKTAISGADGELKSTEKKLLDARRENENRHKAHGI